MRESKVSGSFRDPAGFVFKDGNGHFFRQINVCGKEDFDFFQASGLSNALLEKGLLVPYQESHKPPLISDTAYKVIQPVEVPFISYPYEWSFSQLKEAALNTLRVQEIALQYGMTLKDASSFNFQIFEGRMILIDTLSFARKPADDWGWEAYNQFCDHFLSPLLLAKYSNPGVFCALKAYPEGLPVDLTSKMLPSKTYFMPQVFLHTHLRKKLQKTEAGKPVASQKNHQISKDKALNILRSLKELVAGLEAPDHHTTWSNYYAETHNYSSPSMAKKEQLVLSFFEKTKAQRVCDLGANEGKFSRLISSSVEYVVSADIDYNCVDKNWLTLKKDLRKNLIPIVMDITNPSPSLGWDTTERDSFFQRSHFDLTLALALFHHLAIGKNVPMDRIFSSLARTCKSLVIEFVPKEDSQVIKMLQQRKDVFPNYTIENFESAAAMYFEIELKAPIPDTSRTLYLMTKRSHDAH